MIIERRNKLYKVLEETKECFLISMGSIVGNVLVDKNTCQIISKQ